MALPNEQQPNDVSATDNDRVQDAGNADAAKFNADEQERFVNERISSETDLMTDDASDQHDTPAADQGSKTELEDNLGGGTNLSLDQLKKEGGPESR